MFEAVSSPYLVPFDRLTVARILVASLEALGLAYPEVGVGERARFDEMRRLERDER